MCYIVYNILIRNELGFFKVKGEKNVRESTTVLPTGSLLNIEASQSEENQSHWENKLCDMRKRILDGLKKWLLHYSFTYERFNIQPVRVGDGYLKGRVYFGQNVKDEWFIVFLLLELSQEFQKEIMITVSDDDGQFLLIEGAELLPDWITPENCHGRTLLYCGNLHLVDSIYVPALEFECDKQTDIILEKCATFVSKHDKKCCISPLLKQEIFKDYLDDFPEPGITQSFHQFTTILPENCTILLDSFPHLAGLAAYLFLNEKKTSLDLINRKKFCSVEEKFQKIDIKLPSFMYKDLVNNTFQIPSSFENTNYIPHICNIQQKIEKYSASNKIATRIALKLICGLEILFIQLSRQEESKSDTIQIPLLFNSQLEDEHIFKNYLSIQYLNLKNDDYDYLIEKENRFNNGQSLLIEMKKILQGLNNHSQNTTILDNSLVLDYNDSWISISDNEDESNSSPDTIDKDLFNMNHDFINTNVCFPTDDLTYQHEKAHKDQDKKLLPDAYEFSEMDRNKVKNSHLFEEAIKNKTPPSNEFYSADIRTQYNVQSTLQPVEPDLTLVQNILEKILIE